MRSLYGAAARSDVPDGASATLAAPDGVARARAQLALGVEHIFTGYDHLAFLATLLFAAASLGPRRGTRHALASVTAFTAAHSLTLALAALSVVRVAPRVVEPLIALSITAVALWNLRAPAATPDAAHGSGARWPAALGFGLVHGLGFATALEEAGFARGAALGPLLLFNAGVELGQLAVSVAVFPVLLVLRRARFTALETLASGALLGALALLLARHGAPLRYGAPLLYGGALALAALARRYGYARGALRGASVALALLGLYWALARVRG